MITWKNFSTMEKNFLTNTDFAQKGGHSTAFLDISLEEITGFSTDTINRCVRNAIK